jgi:hypothetical protein
MTDIKPSFFSNPFIKKWREKLRKSVIIKANATFPKLAEEQSRQTLSGEIAG